LLPPGPSSKRKKKKKKKGHEIGSNSPIPREKARFYNLKFRNAKKKSQPRKIGFLREGKRRTPGQNHAREKKEKRRDHSDSPLGGGKKSF